jgi:hypothetical protein
MFDLEQLLAAVRQWGYDRNLCTLDCIESQTLKLVSEFGEIFEGIEESNEAKTKDGIGDTLVVAILMGERIGYPIPAILIEAHLLSTRTLGCEIALGRLADMIGKKQYELARAELHNFIMQVCSLARNELGLDPIECLHGAYEEIKDRKGVMYNGMFIKESDPAYEGAKAAIEAARAAVKIDAIE